MRLDTSFLGLRVVQGSGQGWESGGLGELSWRIIRQRCDGHLEAKLSF